MIIEKTQPSAILQAEEVSKAPPVPGSFAHNIQSMQNRLGLDEPSAARYLGVPVHTYRKWANGERTPSAAVVRLLDVLGMIEAMAPDLHAHLIPPHH